MRARVEYNPNWPISFLLKQIDERSVEVKLFHEAGLYYIQGKYSRSLAIFERIILEDKEWPVFYNAALCSLQLGYIDKAIYYMDQSRIHGLPSRVMEAGVDLLWLQGNVDKAYRLSSQLQSNTIKQMYASVIADKITSPHEISKVKYHYYQTQRPKLNIGYFMTATNLCGGSRVLLEHAHELSRRQHNVSIISFDSIPEWYSVSVPFIQTDFLLKGVRGNVVLDFAISGFFWLNYLSLGLAERTYHFAQGDEWTFGYDLNVDTMMKDVVHQFHTIPNRQLVVSTFLAKAIESHFDRSDFVIIPNAVEEIFVNKNTNNPFQIIMVGSETNGFKNVPVMIEALELLKQWGFDVKVIWVSSTPRINQKFQCDFYEKPDRVTLAKLYNTSGIFISASAYEASPLVFLEAMKSKLAIVTSDNGGIRDYINDGENALVIKSIKAIDFAMGIKTLLENEKLREYLACAAWETSKKFTWAKSMEILEDTLYHDLSELTPLFP